MPALLGETEREKLARAAEPMTQQRMLREIAQALEALSADLPLVLFLEDLHWSDFRPSGCSRHSRSAATCTTAGNRHLPVGGNAHRRPSTAHGERGASNSIGYVRRLRLAPLAKEDVAEYLAIRFSDGADKRLTQRPGAGDP